jgi:hypothetical protein
MSQMSREDLIDELVLDAIADDYEPLEMIAESVKSWQADFGLSNVEEAEIQESIVRVTNTALAAAYELGNTVRTINRPISVMDTQEFYFFRTASGLRRILSSPEIKQSNGEQALEG